MATSIRSLGLAAAVLASAACSTPPPSALRFLAGRYERSVGLSAQHRLTLDAQGRFLLEERESGNAEQEFVGGIVPAGDRLVVEFEGTAAGVAHGGESPTIRPRAFVLRLARQDLWLVPEEGVADFDRYRETGDRNALRRSGAFRRVE